MKFTHMGDCHLGGWKQPELADISTKSFRYAIDKSIQEKVDFILIAGDLFDSPYPSIETLKTTFEEFKKIKQAQIQVYLIAGSHDYSVSGKTFLDVLEKAGFCKNVARFEEKESEIILEPTIHQNIAIYGYPGKKSGMEVEEVERIKLQETPGLFSILMLHTTIRDAIGSLPIKAVDEKKLPRVDYTALAHLHTHYAKNGRVYCGPTFPNNISELEDLRCGSFYIFNNGNLQKEKIELCEILPLYLEITNALTATDDILALIQAKEVKNKIILLKLSGNLQKGKITDIDFGTIEKKLKEQRALAFLRSTTQLKHKELEIAQEVTSTEFLEEQLIKKFEEKNPGKFNTFIHPLIRSLQAQKQEDETNMTFEERLLAETKKALQV